MMLHHVTVGVSNIVRSTECHDTALRPRAIKRLYAGEKGFAGHGIGGKAFFWIGSRPNIEAVCHSPHR